MLSLRNPRVRGVAFIGGGLICAAVLVALPPLVQVGPFSPRLAIEEAKEDLPGLVKGVEGVADKAAQAAGNVYAGTPDEQLLVAARRGDIDHIRSLLASGASVKYEETLDEGCLGYTALMFAVQYDHVRAVSILLDAGSDPNHRTPNGSSPLHIAGPAMIELLKSKGASE